MEDPRISQQQVSQPLSGTELLPIVQQSVNTGNFRTLRTDINTLKDYLVRDFTNSLYPPGVVMPYASNIVDSNMGNWLLCDGRAVSLSEYPRLYSSIGKMYGSVDANSFNLPDLRGRVIIGYCDTAEKQTFNFGKWNTSNYTTIGSTGGMYNNKLQKSNFPFTYTNFPTDKFAMSMTGSSTAPGSIVQDVNVSTIVDGSDYLSFRGNALSVAHRKFGYIYRIDVNQITTNNSTNSIISSNSNTRFNYNTVSGVLPFSVLQTSNVKLLNVTGRSAISITTMPTQSNNYTTTVLIDDDGPGGEAYQSFTLRYSTQYVVVDGAAASSISTMQPYMALNYIIKY